MLYPSFGVFLAHLVDNLDEGFVCFLRLPIPLGVIRQWLMVLDPIELHHLSYLFVDKWSTIVTYDSMRYSKSNNYVFFDEVHHSSFCGFAEWYDLCLFSEVFRSPTKLSPHVWKGHEVTMLCKLCRWVWIRLACTWQLCYLFTNSTISLFIVG